MSGFLKSSFMSVSLPITWKMICRINCYRSRAVYSGCNEYRAINVIQCDIRRIVCKSHRPCSSQEDLTHQLKMFFFPTAHTQSLNQAPVSLCCIHVTWEHWTELTALRCSSTVFMHSKSSAAVKHHNGRSSVRVFVSFLFVAFEIRHCFLPVQFLLLV